MLVQWSPHQVTKSVKTPDYLAVLNYAAATSLQYGSIAVFLHFFQISILSKIKKMVITVPSVLASILPPAVALELPSKIVNTVPSALVALFVLFMSLKSRIFSPLDNSRPKPSNQDPKRLKPSWQPPPLAFPIIWSSIAVLRTIATVMIFQTTGTLLCTPIFAFFGHLSIGDTWNTVTNVEKRLGTSVLGVSFVWLSAAITTYLYYKTNMGAGKILFPMNIWLSVASFLVYTIWKLNSKYDRHSLFPSREEGPRSSWTIPFTTKKSIA
jgi:tryptophan-rich sensory protein